MWSARLSEAERLNEQARAYQVQYLAVMLIVLCGIIGAFFSKPRAVAISLPTSVFQDEQEQAQVLSSKVHSDLFDKESGEPNEGKLGAIAAVLLSHDVDAKIEIIRHPSESFEASLARSVSIYKFLMRASVPADAVSVFVSESNDSQLDKDLSSKSFDSAVRVELIKATSSEVEKEV